MSHCNVAGLSDARTREFRRPWYNCGYLNTFSLISVIQLNNSSFNWIKKYISFLLLLLLHSIHLFLLFSRKYNLFIDFFYYRDYDTHSRLSDYLVGIIGGIILHSFRGKALKMKKVGIESNAIVYEDVNRVYHFFRVSIFPCGLYR